MENKMSAQEAMHNVGAESCWGGRTKDVERPFGSAITPDEMTFVHKVEEVSECMAQYKVNEHQRVVDQPDHYKHGTFEVIDELVMVFGLDATINFCLMNAWKYRARAPYKGNPSQDMEKADRYMQYAHDLQLKKVMRDVGKEAAQLPLLKCSGRKPVSIPAQEEDKKRGARR